MYSFFVWQTFSQLSFQQRKLSAEEELKTVKLTREMDNLKTQLIRARVSH